MTVIQVNTIKNHEPYAKYLYLIEKHRMNLIIELPMLPSDGETS